MKQFVADNEGLSLQVKLKIANLKTSKTQIMSEK